MKRLVLCVLLLLSTALPSGAVQPGEQLADPVMEARARALSREIRCLVCQNESIDDSEADLAHDLRVIVRERIVAGDNDEQVKAFLVARYGDFVLLKPPVKPVTWLLWFGPFAVVVIAAVGAGFYLRGRQLPEAAPLNATERAELDRLLREEEHQELPKA
jgi:cytochrome c-type biogenesis protein CcmH